MAAAFAFPKEHTPELAQDIRRRENLNGKLSKNTIQFAKAIVKLLSHADEIAQFAGNFVPPQILQTVPVHVFKEVLDAFPELQNLENTTQLSHGFVDTEMTNLQPLRDLLATFREFANDLGPRLHPILHELLEKGQAILPLPRPIIEFVETLLDLDWNDESDSSISETENGYRYSWTTSQALETFFAELYVQFQVQMAAQQSKRQETAAKVLDWKDLRNSGNWLLTEAIQTIGSEFVVNNRLGECIPAYRISSNDQQLSFGSVNSAGHLLFPTNVDSDGEVCFLARAPANFAESYQWVKAETAPESAYKGPSAGYEQHYLIKATVEGEQFFGVLTPDGAFVNLSVDGEVVQVDSDQYWILCHQENIARQASAMVWDSISKEEKARIESAFRKYAGAGESFITLDGFQKLVSDLNIGGSPAECAAAFQEIDQNGNGQVDFNEFALYWTDQDPKTKSLLGVTKVALQMNTRRSAMFHNVTSFTLQELARVVYKLHFGKDETPEPNASFFRHWHVSAEHRTPYQVLEAGSWHTEVRMHTALGPHLVDVLMKRPKCAPLEELFTSMLVDVDIFVPRMVLDLFADVFSAQLIANNPNDAIVGAYGKYFIEFLKGLKSKVSLKVSTKNGVNTARRLAMKKQVEAIAEWFAKAGSTEFNDADFALLEEVSLKPSLLDGYILEDPGQPGAGPPKKLREVFSEGWDTAQPLFNRAEDPGVGHQAQAVIGMVVEYFRILIGLGPILENVFDELIVKQTPFDQFQPPDAFVQFWPILQQFPVADILGMIHNGPAGVGISGEVLGAQLTAILQQDCEALGNKIFDDLLLPGPQIVIKFVIKLIPALINFLLAYNGPARSCVVSSRMVSYTEWNFQVSKFLDLFRTPEALEQTLTELGNTLLAAHEEANLTRYKAAAETRRNRIVRMVEKAKEISDSDPDLGLPMLLGALHRQFNPPRHHEFY